MSDPRILVTSIPVWNDESGSDTFPNLLSGYNPDSVANIFFKSGIPNSPVCKKYYYISENLVIRSIINHGIKTGKVVKAKSRSTEIDIEKKIESKRYSFFSKHRLWLFLIGRELLWKFGKWKTKELNSFVKDFSPDILLFPIESYMYFNHINEYLIKNTHKPCVGILWDDNFTYKGHPYNIGFRIHRYFLRKQVSRIAKKCDKIFVINPKMQRELKDEFNVESEILTKGAKIQKNNIDVSISNSNVIRIVYTGKLTLGRYDTVLLLSKILEKVNKNRNQKYQLDIYSGTKLSSQEKKNLKRLGTRYMGSIPQSKVQDVQKKADILLMVEALYGKHKYDARLSFSTKIVDYLSAGKCILAIGPKDIAPIEYLIENDAALVVTSKEELFKMFANNHLKSNLNEYAKKALNLANTNHDINIIQNKLYKTIRLLNTKNQ